jgi:hypothetical protein
VLRAAVTSIAMSVVALACAPVAPPGTHLLEIEVRNQTARPAELFVMTPAGVLRGAVHPATVPPQSSVTVQVYVPLNNWWQFGPRGGLVRADEIMGLARQGCRVFIAYEGATLVEWGCDDGG